MDIAITMDDAHTFAQGLIADGWLNDDPNCVDTLYRRLMALSAKWNAVASMQTSTAFSCPECCAKQGQPHEPTCSSRTGEVVLYGVLAEYQAGKRGLPTYAELRAMFPEQANAIADPLAISAAAGMQQPPAPSVPQQSLADALHYPGCWDTAAYPTLSDALSAVYGHFKCSECAPAASPVPLPVEPQLVYPPTMTPTLEHVLGFMNFRTGPIAHVFQQAGFAIPTKCEAEQAFVLDRMIRAVLTHGEGWAAAFTNDVRAQQAIIVERKAAAIPAVSAAPERAHPAAATNNVAQVRAVLQTALDESTARAQDNDNEAAS